MLRVGTKSQCFACDAGHGYRVHCRTLNQLFDKVLAIPGVSEV
jgi:hypothetical protein